MGGRGNGGKIVGQNCIKNKLLTCVDEKVPLAANDIEEVRPVPRVEKLFLDVKYATIDFLVRKQWMRSDVG